MTDQNGANNHNGRVTTRDLLAAVEGSEERITHRIDRLENTFERARMDHEQRLTVLETEQAIEDARSRGIVNTIAGIKGFILVAVAIVSVAIGGAGVIVAIDSNSDAFHQTIEVVEP